MKLVIEIITLVLASLLIAREITTLFMFSFKILTTNGEKYVLEDLKDASLKRDIIHVYNATSPMKIRYITTWHSLFFKYYISCHDNSYSVLVPRFSAISDTITKHFQTAKPVY